VFCAGDDTCLACKEPEDSLNLINLYAPDNTVNWCLEGCDVINLEDMNICDDCHGIRPTFVPMAI